MEPSSDASVKERIREARDLARHLEEALADGGAEEERALLAAYGEAIAGRDRLMAESGIGAICSACAARTGSCCFAEIAGEYDAVLLAVNLLLGCELPEERHVEDGCFFVGPFGCRLTARFAFCVNYLCAEVREELGEAMCGALLRGVGAELSAGFEAERSLRRFYGAK